VGGEVGVLVASGLLLGDRPIVPLSGEVGGEADGVRSRLGFSPIGRLVPASLQPAATPASRVSANSPERSLLIG
jgi:hypothetical protein